MAVPLSPKCLAGKRAYTNFRDTIRELFLSKTGKEYDKGDEDIYRLLNAYGDERAAIARANSRLRSCRCDAPPSEQISCTTLHVLVDEIRGKVQGV